MCPGHIGLPEGQKKPGEFWRLERSSVWMKTNYFSFEAAQTATEGNATSVEKLPSFGNADIVTIFGSTQMFSFTNF